MRNHSRLTEHTSRKNKEWSDLNMSSDIKEELAFKVIQFIGPEAEPLYAGSHCTVKILTTKSNTACTQSVF